MKTIRYLLAIALTLSLGSYSASANLNVAYVYDGDTLTLSNGNKVRLVQIDTPELSPAECYGKEARELLRQLIGTSRVTLVKEPLAGNKDSFGRLLRYVKISTKNLNLELVRQGAAAPWFYNEQKGKFSKELLAAARTAKRNQVGLWKACPSTKLDPSRGIDTGPVVDVAIDKSNPSSENEMIQPISPGSFCSESESGKIAFSEKGIQYTCKTSATEQRLRWRR